MFAGHIKLVKIKNVYKIRLNPMFPNPGLQGTLSCMFSIQPCSNTTTFDDKMDNTEDSNIHIV